MSLCFSCPGQGSQHVGMGRDLFDHYDAVKRIYREASEALGYDVAALSFDGPAEELNKTFRTQPCLLVASVAALTALKEHAITPTVVIGHSLGEYSALVAAGSLSLRDAVRLTELRGRIMQEAVPEWKGLMAAVLGLEKQKIVDVCASVTSGYVGVANFNCPGQVLLSGEKAAVEEAIAKAKEHGAKKAIALAVSVPSHSALMVHAASHFEKALAEFTLGNAEIPFVCNIDARVLVHTPYSSLMPVYAKDLYGGGPHTLGLLLSAAGAGARLCVTWLAGRSTIRGLGRVIALAAGTAGVALAGFAYLRVFPLALMLMLLVGAMAVAEPQNPPPANMLAGYDKYELSPIAMGPPYAGDEGKEKAKAKIQDHMSTEIGPVLAQWNVDAAGNARGQSLVIEPRIEKLKVVSGGARFWAGALAGDSYVVMNRD